MVSLDNLSFIYNYVNNFLNYFIKFCEYQYSTEDAYCEMLLLIYFLNLLLFLSLYIEF